MRIVAALGGNALLRRGEPMTAETQRANVRRAVASLLPLLEAGHQLVITHGNGPQVGLLALQAAVGPKEGAYPLDVLDAESEGMVGYLIELELGNALPSGRLIATLLTQVLVDRRDPAFHRPTKPIGPTYEKGKAEELAKARGWAIAKDGESWRRVVPSPQPLQVLEARVIELLVITGCYRDLCGRWGDTRFGTQRRQLGGDRGRDRQGPDECATGASAQGGPFDAAHRRRRRLPQLGNGYSQDHRASRRRGVACS